MITNRAWVLLKSGRRLDLLNPRPEAWTNTDLAIGLSRTYRWGGYSAWDLPLSVAQHSLTVLALRELGGPLNPLESLRELLHDATEGLLGGFDPIFPLRPHLGEDFARLDRRMQAAVDQRYSLPAWTDASFGQHKHADRLAAATEALHVVGWSRQEIRESLGIVLAPLERSPVSPPGGMKEWEPWPPQLARTLFLQRMNDLLEAANEKNDDGRKAGSRYVYVEAPPGQSVEGMVVDGRRDGNDGELIGCNGANCHVETL